MSHMRAARAQKIGSVSVCKFAERRAASIRRCSTYHYTRTSINSSPAGGEQLKFTKALNLGSSVRKISESREVACH